MVCDVTGGDLDNLNKRYTELHRAADDSDKSEISSRLVFHISSIYLLYYNYTASSIA